MSESVDFTIMGREYSVAVSAAQRDTLLAAAAMVDERMRELDARTHAGAETLGVMTALNIAHELLQMQQSSGLDLPAYRRKISAMGGRVDIALAPQEKLF